VNGHLRLRVGAGNRLEDLSFAALAHVSKPHLDAGALVAQMINPTAGLFEGDTLTLEAHATGGGRLCLSVPGANRIHPARGDGFAVCRQTFRVDADSALEFIPELFIPFAGARYRQDIRVVWAPGAKVLCFDWWTPGRVARGESLAFRRLEMHFDAWAGGRLVLRERAALGAGEESLHPWRAAGGEASVLSALVVGADLAPWVAEIEALHQSDVSLGLGPLDRDAWLVRAVCSGNLPARRTLAALRPLLHRALDLRPPALGREI
jgi:urease accessory protein